MVQPSDPTQRGAKVSRSAHLVEVLAACSLHGVRAPRDWQNHDYRRSYHTGINCDIAIFYFYLLPFHLPQAQSGFRLFGQLLRRSTFAHARINVKNLVFNLQVVLYNAKYRVMVCTDSNMAADQIALMLVKYNKKLKIQNFLLRANSRSRVW